MKKYLLILSMLLLSAAAFAQGEAVELVEVTPEAGSVYSFSEESVVFRFDRAVEVAEASIVTPGGEVPVEESFSSDAFYHLYYCMVSGQLKQMANDGKLKAGDTFSVRLKGVCDAADKDVLLGKDGTLTVEYTLAALPAKLVSISPEDGSKLKSYYAPGDKDAQVVVTFDSPLSSCAQVQYSYGDMESGTLKRVDVPFTLDKERIIVDFGGIQLDKVSLEGATAISLRVGPVKAENGELVEGNAQGAPGYVIVGYDIAQEAVSSVYGGFDGGDIDGECVEGWVSAPVKFDGVRFAFNLHGVSTVVELPAGFVKVVPAPEAGYPDAIALTVPVADFNFDAGLVTVSLVNAKDADGHAVKVESPYTSKGRSAERGVCLSVSPAPGDLAGAPEEFVFVFNDFVTVESAVMNFEGEEDVDVLGQCVAENNVVTIATLRGRKPSGSFGLMLKVKDGQGRYVTFGETADEVNVQYRVLQNVYGCSAIAPAEGSVESLETFVLAFANPADPNDFVGGFDTAKTPALLDANGETVATGTMELTDGSDWENCHLTLDKPVTATGVYTLVIPEATVFNSMYSDMNEDFGVSYGAIYNPELRFTFTIGAVGIASAPATGTGQVSVYDLRGVPVAKGHAGSVAGKLAPGIYIVNGKKTYVK